MPRQASKRIQRKRTKGWRMPEGAVYVGRPSKWGNTWKVGSTIDGSQGCRGLYVDAPLAVDLFRTWVLQDEFFRALVRTELAGKDLACWCPLGWPCHADVLLEIANGGAS